MGLEESADALAWAHTGWRYTFRNARALSDRFFVERKFYPNVDFYSGVILRALGILTNMFTGTFTIGRLPGWIAHWKEQYDDPGARIARRRQIYGSPVNQYYIPVDVR